MKKIYLSSLIFISSLFFFSELKGQGDCTTTLQEAQTIYDEGRIHEVEEKLKDCLKSGFTSEEKVQALKLMALTYLYMDEPEKADEMILGILEENPLFKPNPAVDPVEFINLYESFRTTPIFRVGIKGGLNYAKPNFTSGGGVNNLNDLNLRGENKLALGYRLGVAFELPLNKKMTLGTELKYVSTSFKMENLSLITDFQGNLVTDNLLITTISSYELPAYLQYKVMDIKSKELYKNSNVFVFLGGSVEYNTGASSIALRNVENNQPVKEANYNLDYIVKLNYSAILGIGAKIQIGTGYFITDVKYRYGIMEVTDYTNSLNDLQPYYFDHYADYNTYKLTSLTLSVGYLQNIYNPKKKTK